MKKPEPITEHPVEEVIQLSEATYILRIQRNNLSFTAGQFVNISLPDSDTSREYTIYSGENQDSLDFLIRIVPTGAFSPLIKNLQKSDIVLVDAPKDESFTLSEFERAGAKLLFIASGTGIAPFHSMTQTYPNLNYRLLHGVRHLSDRYNADHYSPEDYISCVTAEDGGNFKGRVTEFIRQNPVKEVDRIYICGSSQMIFDVKDLLVEQGNSIENIRTELFF